MGYVNVCMYVYTNLITAYEARFFICMLFSFKPEILRDKKMDDNFTYILNNNKQNYPF